MDYFLNIIIPQVFEPSQAYADTQTAEEASDKGKCMVGCQQGPATLRHQLVSMEDSDKEQCGPHFVTVVTKI